MKLQIQPLEAFCDQKINICVPELPANERVIISASRNLHWAKRIKFEWVAWFIAGGSLEGNAHARVDSWEKAIEFSRNSLHAEYEEPSKETELQQN